MTGVVCAVCGQADNLTTHPVCDKPNCPGRQTFIHMMPKPDACEHVWDGPHVDIGNGMSVTCSKCGLSAFSHSLMQGW